MSTRQRTIHVTHTDHPLARGTRRPALAVAAAVLVALPLSACSQDHGAVDTDDAVETTDQDQTEPEAGIDPATFSFEDLSDDLGERVGEEVMVTAEVERIITPGVFLINALEGHDLEPIAVVETYPGADVEPGDEIVFTGTVEEQLVPRKVEKLLDVQLDDETLTDYDGRPYIEMTKVHSETA